VVYQTTTKENNMIKFLKRLFVKEKNSSNEEGQEIEKDFDILYALFDDDYFNERIKAKNAFIEAIENPNENPNNVSAETKQKFAELMKGDKNARD
jgi:hypothetical protein